MRRTSARTLIVVAVVAVAVAAGVLAAANPFDDEGSGAGRATAARLSATAPLDRVSFAATHNSMSAADQAGWEVHRSRRRGSRPGSSQGIRGLLIDMYYAVRTRRGIQNVPVAKVDEPAPPGGQGPRRVPLSHLSAVWERRSATDALREPCAISSDAAPARGCS